MDCKVDDCIVRYLSIGRCEKKLQSELYSAALCGDWKKAEEILEEHPKEITLSSRLSIFWETSLQIAVRAGHTKLVERLVEMMSKAELSIETVTGDTAFSSAVQRGHFEIARITLKKRPDLGLSTLRSLGCNWKYCSPISCLFGHSHMVRHLYEVTKNLLEERDHADLLLTLIDRCFYDIANEMLSENPGLAIQVNSKGETALYAIAGKVSKTQNKLPKRRIELIKELLKQANGHADLIKGALFRAAQEGNCEFLTRALRLYPGLAIELDNKKQTIFHVAVQYRHVDVLYIIQATVSIRSFILTDREGNGILHLAAKWPLSGLKVVAGAGPEHVLQLQRELLWFEEVKKVVGPQHMIAKNESCTLLFDKEHEELRRKGEKWLKKTAESCMLVATLITTLSFIAGVGALGDNNRNHTQRPDLVDNLWFKTFATSNAITLLSSASSVLFFQSILTATFTTNAFLKSLPFKLLLGLVSLVTSILAMMVSCFAAFFGTFNRHELRFAYPVAVVAFISVPFVARLYLPLLYHVFRSTIMPFLRFRRNRFFVPQLENKYE